MIYNFSNFNSRKDFLKKHKNTIFDIIIIGTGPAGYVLYDKLKKKKNILIIEKGSSNLKLKKILDFLDQAEPQISGVVCLAILRNLK